MRELSFAGARDKLSHILPPFGVAQLSVHFEFDQHPPPIYNDVVRHGLLLDTLRFSVYGKQLTSCRQNVCYKDKIIDREMLYLYDLLTSSRIPQRHFVYLQKLAKHPLTSKRVRRQRDVDGILTSFYKRYTAKNAQWHLVTTCYNEPIHQDTFAWLATSSVASPTI